VLGADLSGSRDHNMDIVEQVAVERATPNLLPKTLAPSLSATDDSARLEGDRGPGDGSDQAGGRFTALEGYRGLAALLIVVFHLYQFMRFGNPAHYPYADTAWNLGLQQLDGFVDLFFVLSAFLLTLPYARAALSGGRPMAGREFLYRRSVRIVPLYFVAVLLVWSARNTGFPGDWRDLLAHLTFVQVYDQRTIFFTIGPAWSLAVEVQFYLLLAILGGGLCWICRRLDSVAARRTVLYASVTAIAALGLGSRLLAAFGLHRSADDWPFWFGLPAKLDVFAVGILLAVIVATRPDRTALNHRVAWSLRLLGLGLLCWGSMTRASDPLPELFFHDWCALGFGLLLSASVLGHRRGSGGLLATRPLAGLGMVSYSLYIWHEPLMLSLAGRGLLPTPGTPLAFPFGLTVLVPAALVVAYASYRIIEYPASRLRHNRDADGRHRDYYDGT